MEMAVGFTPKLKTPNPFEPVLAMSSLPDRSPSQPSVVRLLTKRAEMLAATRRSIAAAGYDRFTVRSVSEECAVTTQTVYNSFGCRQELLVKALNEHTIMMEDAASRISPGPGAFLTLADLYYHCAIERPDFLREIVMASFSTKERLATMQRHSIQNKIRMLKSLPKTDFLCASIDVGVLATQITRVNSFAVYDWAQNGDVNELHTQLTEGNKLLLKGVLRTPRTPL
jgi:AcrR family transcriptional regulator